MIFNNIYPTSKYYFRRQNKPHHFLLFKSCDNILIIY